MRTSTTVSRCLKKGIRFLESARVPEAKISAEELLSHVLDRPRFSLYLDSQSEIGREIEAEYETLLARRAGRYPLQYLVRTVPFRNAVLEIGEGCLIPRPETEILADEALHRLEAGPLFLLDMGTGSGNIAVSLTQERPAWLIAATDISKKALQYAKMNAVRNGVAERIHFVRTDLWQGIRANSFDAIISNPPYVREGELGRLQPEIAFEPQVALNGGADGLLFYRRMSREARSVLKPGGFVFFEIGAGQARDVSHILEVNGFCEIQVVNDHRGIERIVSAQLVNHG